MEIQLQELIEQIKKEGVETAEKEAASIIETANSEAEKIIASAKAEAKKILAQAKEENDHLVRVGEEALRQAGRNVLLSFRESVARELSVVVGDSVDAVCKSDALAGLIVEVVRAWSVNPEVEDIAVLLNNDDAAKLEGAVLSALKAHMLEGVTVRPNNNFDGGFRISVNGGRAYYDYSSEAVTDMMASYLSPKVTALLKEAEKV